MKRFASSVTAFFILVTFAVAGDRGNTRIRSFNKSKRLLIEQVYFDHTTTFYCGCVFDSHKKLKPSDRYTPKKENKRSRRIEWEHIVPAHAFGQNCSEWRFGHPACVNSKGKAFKGRKCASKVNPEFRYMQADMYNLVPAIGEINGLRSNYRFAIIDGEKREFGQCDMEIADRQAEPPPEIRGDIARTYFYMEAAYPGRGITNPENMKLFEAWDRSDPVDQWECERARRILKIQGNSNSVVFAKCAKLQPRHVSFTRRMPDSVLDKPGPASVCGKRNPCPDMAFTKKRSDHLN